jgi:hypothetical protein
MTYFLLVIFLGSETYIESYSTRADCEVRREQIRIESRGASTNCISMEGRSYV